MRFRLKRIKSLLKTNIYRTIWFNFKMLPFAQARYLPFFIYGKIMFRSLRGEVVLDTMKIYPGMIKIGWCDYYVTTSLPQSVWTINGKLVFKGRINFLQGNYVLVSDNAILTFGTNGTFVGSNSIIICFNSITIGDNVEITWDCQLMDTSFHYIELLENDKEIRALTSPIKIDHDVWIGNRTTISKGTRLPSNIIVASNSMVNKDFSNIPSYSLLAGCPAKLKVVGSKRIYDKLKEKELDLKFGYSRTHL